MESFAKELAGNFVGVLKKYFVIKGRAGRKEFWYFVLADVIICFPLFILSLIPVLGVIFRVVLSLFGLVTLIPSITVSVRRLHDTNKPGWLLLIGVIPSIISVMLLPMAIISIAGGFFFLALTGFIGILSLVGCIILLVFAIMAGTPGENKYGAVPGENAALNDWNELKDLKDVFNKEQQDSPAPASEAKKAETPAKEKSVFCSECGAKNVKGAKFCSSCGKPIA